MHHGTYNLEPLVVAGRGYTPAGVECWNGIRGHRLPVSAAGRGPGADRRDRHLAAAGRRRSGSPRPTSASRWPCPVSGMSDLESYVTQQGHQRPLRLHVPRQHLPVGVDDDRGPDRPAAAAVRQLATTTRSSRWTATAASSTGCGSSTRCTARRELVDEYVSKGGHDYRPDLRVADLRLHQQAPEGRHRPGEGRATSRRSTGKDLRVFPEDKDLPKDAINDRDRRDVRAEGGGEAAGEGGGVRGVEGGAGEEAAGDELPGAAGEGAGRWRTARTLPDGAVVLHVRARRRDVQRAAVEV